jgi:REP element-mobilizing transposase RayT
MSHSYHNGFYHFVWTTWDRRPLLTGDREAHAYALIQQQCRHMKAEVLALGGIPDHVHLLVTLPTTLGVADFMETVKGVSAHAMNKASGSPTFSFKWQGGYSYHTVSISHVRTLLRYIANQKEHHAAGSLVASCEPPMRDVLTVNNAPAQAGGGNFISPAVQGGE